MKHGALWAVLAGSSLFTACASITAHVDYDREVDLDSYKTFAWAPSTETSVEDTSPFVHQRIVHAVRNKLVAGGMAENTADPDVFVTYHTNEKQDMQLRTDYYGYGYGSGWYWSPYWAWGGPMMATSSAHVYTYKKGSLIIDIWDARTKNLIYRGTVEGVVSETPKGAEKQIIKAVDILSKEFKSERKRVAKAEAKAQKKAQ